MKLLRAVKLQLIIKIKIFRKFLHLEHLKIQLFNTTLALIRKCFFNLEIYIYGV